MKKHEDIDIKQDHIGPSLDELLKEDGIYEDVVVAATKKALAFKLEQLMREQHITKTELANQRGGGDDLYISTLVRNAWPWQSLFLAY